MLGMTWILAVAAALGADAFSLALALGLAGGGKRFFLMLPLVVAGLHILMPLAGMLIGKTFGAVFGHIAVLLGAGILIYLGGRTLFTLSNHPKERDSHREVQGELWGASLRRENSYEGLSICLLAFGVSLDALSVGFSLGTLGGKIGFTVLIMGVTAGLMTLAGFWIGRFAGMRLGKKAEFMSGLILLLIGVKLIF